MFLLHIIARENVSPPFKSSSVHSLNLNSFDILSLFVELDQSSFQQILIIILKTVMLFASVKQNMTILT